MKEKTGVIYRIYLRGCISKCYIGQTINPQSRIEAHLSGYGKSPILRNAIKKYGRDAFVVEILESDAPESWLSKLEILHIRFFNSTSPNGYNLTSGGEGLRGHHFSDEHRKKLSMAQTGRTPSEETRRKLSIANKNPSAETRRRMSEATRGKNNGNFGNRGDKNPMFGKRRPPEVRKRISESKKGKSSPLKGRKGHEAWNKGKVGLQKHSSETKQKLSKLLRGKTKKPRTAEHCRKISENMKGNTTWLGKRHTDASKLKISESNKGKRHTDTSKLKMSISKRSPEYDSALAYYLSLPADTSIKEKRKRLRETFPNINRRTIYDWVRRWELE